MNPRNRYVGIAFIIAIIFSVGNLAIALAIAMIFSMVAAHADDAASLQTEIGRFERNAAITGQGHASSRISQDFASFAGSRANATRLVTGLQHGAPITLISREETRGDTVNATVGAGPRTAQFR